MDDIHPARSAPPGIVSQMSRDDWFEVVNVVPTGGINSAERPKTESMLQPVSFAVRT